MAGIYIHIPFCKSRCIYCDFYSTTSREMAAAYIDALTRELTLRSSYLPSNKQHPDIETIYIGGGTPSLLEARQLEHIFDTIYRTYDVHGQAEITIEANPDDLSPQKITELRRLPVNRLSIGIQTFCDDRLQQLRRRHRGQQAVQAVLDCQAAGFDNISIDLIYGLPGQTAQEWNSDLCKALDLHPRHISAYSLTYEPGTPIWKMREQKLVKEADEQLSLSMFETLIDRLTAAGFEHYEISNFAQPGFRSRHNSSYWNDVPYLGCGASAHSFDGCSRQWNCRSLRTYTDGVAACRNREDFAGASWIEREELSLHERYNDCIVTALRTAQGIDLQKLRRKFGNELADYCLRNAQPYLRRGLLEIGGIEKEHAPQGMLRLTRKGLFVSDGIMCDLLRVDD